MADRYQDRPYPDQDDHGRGGDPHAAGRPESDPLAELARLIGQTDPFAMGRANVKVQPHAEQRQPVQRYEPPAQQYEPPIDDEPLAGPPPWMQRANRQEAAPPPPQEEYYEEPEYQPSPVHPLHRYAAQHAAQQPQYAEPQQQYQQPQYQDEQHYAQAQQPLDPSRYDDALYGQIESGQNYQRDPAYPDDPYAYQNAYDEEPEEQPRKRGGLFTVAAVLALAVLGTGGAFAYRSFVGSPRSGEPPIIKADHSPTKVVPATADTPKAPDRMALGDGKEKLVPREETPVDVNARSGPRVVFPPLNQNANPPTPASVAPTAAAPASANGTLPNAEPRRIRTLSVKGDQADAGVPQGAAPPPPRPAAPTARTTTSAPPPQPAAPAPRNPTSANASANGPLSLSPGSSAAAEPPARVAAVAPTASAPAGNGGNFLVQLSSQKTEADAQASYRALQSKFSNVLGSRPPVIRRADLGEKGTVYRAFVGPFSTKDEATTFCSNFRTAGGQCFVPSN